MCQKSKLNVIRWLTCSLLNLISSGGSVPRFIRCRELQIIKLFKIIVPHSHQKCHICAILLYSHELCEILRKICIFLVKWTCPCTPVLLTHYIHMPSGKCHCLLYWSFSCLLWAWPWWNTQPSNWMVTAPRYIPERSWRVPESPQLFLWLGWWKQGWKTWCYWVQRICCSKSISWWGITLNDICLTWLNW